MRGRLQCALKPSEIEQTRRPEKLVHHRIQLEEIHLLSCSSRAVGRTRFEGQCMHGTRLIYQVLKPVCNWEKSLIRRRITYEKSRGAIKRKLKKTHQLDCADKIWKSNKISGRMERRALWLVDSKLRRLRTLIGRAQNNQSWRCAWGDSCEVVSGCK